MKNITKSLIFTLALFITSYMSIKAEHLTGNASTTESSQNNPTTLKNFQPLKGTRKFSLQTEQIAPLEGTIQHTDCLPPVEYKLRPGMPFDERVLPSAIEEEGWYWIPAWGAGTWQRDVNRKVGIGTWPLGTSIAYTDHITSRPFGWQVDKNGGIWDYYYVPYLEYHDNGNVIELKMVLRYKPIEINNQRCIAVTWLRTIQIDKMTRMITTVYQQEEIDTFRPASRGRVRQDGSVKWFDLNGRPTYQFGKPTDKFYAYEYQVRPFSPIDFMENGRDMRLSFKNYLISHNLTELVPDELR